MDTNAVSIERGVLLAAHAKLTRLREALASLEVDGTAANVQRVRAAGKHELAALLWLLADLLKVEPGSPTVRIPPVELRADEPPALF